MRAAKTDANQAAIVAALRAAGATVESLHRVGGGVPDILVGYRGRSYPVEIKDGSKPPSARTLTPDQVRWHAAWKGDVYVVESVAEALDVLRG